jgi:hypothetical protein
MLCATAIEDNSPRPTTITADYAADQPATV